MLSGAPPAQGTSLLMRIGSAVRPAVRSGRAVDPLTGDHELAVSVAELGLDGAVHVAVQVVAPEPADGAVALEDLPNGRLDARQAEGDTRLVAQDVDVVDGGRAL